MLQEKYLKLCVILLCLLGSLVYRIYVKWMKIIVFVAFLRDGKMSHAKIVFEVNPKSNPNPVKEFRRIKIRSETDKNIFLDPKSSPNPSKKNSVHPKFDSNPTNKFSWIRNPIRTRQNKFRWPKPVRLQTETRI